MKESNTEAVVTTPDSVSPIKPTGSMIAAAGRHHQLLSETPPTAQQPLPANIDAASYAAGQNAAWSTAFQSVIPSQQALGSLFNAVDNLHTRLEEDAQAVRSLQLDQARLQMALEATGQRLDIVEHAQLPKLQEKWEHLATRPAISPDVAEALTQLRTVLSNISQQQQSSGMLGGASSLLGLSIVYSMKLVSKAEVAAVILSRKVLLADVFDNKHKVQKVASIGLFVAGIELAWQLQQRVSTTVPGVVRPFTAPLRTCLKIARAAVWMSVFVLSFSSARELSQQTCTRLAENIEATRMYNLMVKKNDNEMQPKKPAVGDDECSPAAAV